MLADLLARKAALSDALIAGAKPVLGRARGILTLSYSSTVEALLLEAAAPDCLVIVAESRPLLEGRKLCRSLEAAGRRVRCITDAQIGLALADADMALIGADAVLGDLAVVNKAGSLFAALAARAQGKPCHAAADTFKIDPLASSADAVFEEMAADEVWPERPEICLSGVNHGPNMGEDVLYSGTVAAAMEATVMGIPSIALSYVGHRFEELEGWEAVVQAILEGILERDGVPEDTLFNVNLPAVAPEEVRGIKVTSLGRRRYSDSILRAKDPMGKEYFWIGGGSVSWRGPEDSDFQAVEDGYVSVTPLHLDLTNYKLLEEIRAWDLGL